MIDIDLFEKIINENKKHLIHLNLYFQGEPYLHQGIYKMLEICKKNKIFTSTSTNGHYIDTTSAEKTIKAGLDKIIISLDGTTQESYEKYRVGGKLEKVLLAIDCFSKAKQKLKSSIKIVVQFIVFKYNEYEIEDVKKYIKKYKNVDLQIKTAQIYDFEKAKELLPIQTKFSRYKMDANNMPILKNKFENECWRMWHSAVVTWDGKMLPCCFDKDAKYEFGNIRKEKLDTIWNSEKYHYFRTKILSNRKEIDICQNCTEGSQVFA
jgi:radical SAM protein with 4Fe4S-binding SPASM domain